MEGVVVIVYSPGNTRYGPGRDAGECGTMVYLNHPPEQLSTFEAACLEEARDLAAEIGRTCLQRECGILPYTVYDATMWLFRIELGNQEFDQLPDEVKWNFVSFNRLRAIPGFEAAWDHVRAAVED